MSQIYKEDNLDEARKEPEHKEPSEYAQKRRMRRVPDFLPVSLQDFLHGRQPELRAQVNVSFNGYD
jgi:hypothetical protein